MKHISNKSKILLGMTTLTLSMPILAAKVDYKIDPTHTATVFSWDHFGFATPSGNFRDVQGIISIDDKNPSKSSVNVTIPVSSINTNVVALDEHLLSDDFFESKKYPTITFKSTKVEKVSGNKYKISGNLTIKNITKPVVLDTVLNKKAAHPTTKLATVGFNATTSFNRSAFDVGGYVPHVGDKIKVNITTEASAEK